MSWNSVKSQHSIQQSLSCCLQTHDSPTRFSASLFHLYASGSQLPPTDLLSLSILLTETSFTRKRNWQGAQRWWKPSWGSPSTAGLVHLFKDLDLYRGTKSIDKGKRMQRAKVGVPGHVPQWHLTSQHWSFSFFVFICIIIFHDMFCR